MVSKYDSAKTLEISRARFPKTCERCGANIRKGDQYLRETLGPMAKPPGLHLATYCLNCGQDQIAKSG